MVTLLLCAEGQAQRAFEGGEFKPYDEIAVVKDSLTEPLERRVLYFAQFTCPYCRQIHAELRAWSRQLPQPYQFEVVPAVGNNEHIGMAIAYYVVIQVRPKRLDRFEDELFKALQDRNMDPMDPRTYEQVAGRIGISSEEFRRGVQSEETRQFVRRAHLLTERYTVEEVPTIIVANRFKTGPARVYHENESFVAILNGLISMDLRQR